jgi:uncharacterized protein YpuA (DUF1002 family)
VIYERTFDNHQVHDLEELRKTVHQLQTEMQYNEVNLDNSDLNDMVDDFDKMKYLVLSQIEIQNQIQQELLKLFKKE